MAQAASRKHKERSGYIAVNGIRFYFEAHGDGKPLIMLHGGLGGIEEFGALPTLLGQYRQVITVELQGHGRTADTDRPLRYEWMADDVAGLIRSLGFHQADVLGFSLGGNVALRLAIQFPQTVHKLILISTPIARAGIDAHFRASMEGLNTSAAQFMLETPMYQLYRSVAPDVSAWSTLVGKVGDLLRQDYDWSQDASALKIPLLLLAGDEDMISPSHMTETFGTLPNAQIVILPQTDHFRMLSRTDVLLTTITHFLNMSTQPNQ